MTDNAANTGVNAADAAKPTRASTPRTPPGWLVTTVAAVFGLVYAYFEWDAIRNVVELRAAIAAQESVLSSTTFTVPWGSVIAAIIAPVLLYAVALIAGRRSSIVRRAVYLALGLAVLSCTMLSIYALGGS